MPVSLTLPGNEKARIAALRKYEILDTLPDASFDHLTQLAATLFQVPVALISLVDEDRIWFKSKVGLSLEQTAREPGLCASAILLPEIYVVENALEDQQAQANSLVTGEPGVRFYAAAPLFTREGFCLGTFCLIDQDPRILPEPQKEVLKRLADIVVDEIELRLSARTLLTTVYDDLQNSTRMLEELPEALRNEKVESTLAASRKLVQTLQQQLHNPKEVN